MKKFLFVDNEQKQYTQEADAFHYQYSLRKHFGINPETEVEYIHGFWHKCQEEKDTGVIEDMLLHQGKAIITHSMYTTTHYGSLFTFLHLLNIAGRRRVRDLIYINTSSEDYMLQALEYGWRNNESVKNLLQAVSRNHLLSYNYDRETITRVTLDLKQDCGVFVTEDVSQEEYQALISKLTN